LHNPRKDGRQDVEEGGAVAGGNRSSRDSIILPGLASVNWQSGDSLVVKRQAAFWQDRLTTLKAEAIATGGH